MLSSRLSLVCLASLALGACASSSSSSGGAFKYYLESETALYTGQPSLMRPPDAYLPAGTRVRALSGQGDFVRIETVTGRSGFVPIDAVREQGNR